MLGLAEYTAQQAELLKKAQYHQKRINSLLDTASNRNEAVNLSRKISLEYYQDFQKSLVDNLQEIGLNATAYYNAAHQLGLTDEEQMALVREIVAKQFNEKYFGASLDERLKVNLKRLMRNVQKSSLWGTVGKGADITFKGLRTLLDKPVPYGAQHNIDKRILLATAVKIEQDVAKEIAGRAGVTLIKWNLSQDHPQKDICDEYARRENEEVVAYIKKNKLDISPEGVYFADNLPLPPHPNCMCEYGLMHSVPAKQGIVKRTAKKVRQLLRRIRGK